MPVLGVEVRNTRAEATIRERLRHDRRRKERDARPCGNNSDDRSPEMHRYFSQRDHGLADLFDDLDELVYTVALQSREVDELPCPRDDGPSLRRPGDGDAAAASKLQQPLVA